MPQGPNDPTAAAGFAGKNLRVLESGFSSMAALGTRFDFCFFQMGVFLALRVLCMARSVTAVIAVAMRLCLLLPGSQPPESFGGHLCPSEHSASRAEVL